MTKKQEAGVKDCSKQLESLYVHFGKFLFESVEQHKIRYFFDPHDEDAEREAKRLFQQVTDPAPIVLRQRSQKVKPFEKRGLLELYTKLMVQMYQAKKKLLVLREDVEECLSLALLNFDGDNSVETDSRITRLKTLESSIIRLLDESSEAVRKVMTKKKKIIDGSDELKAIQTSELEKDFLEKAATEIKNISKNIEALTKDTKTCLNDIASVYEKELEAQALRAAENDSRESDETDEDNEVDDVVDDKPDQDAPEDEDELDEAEEESDTEEEDAHDQSDDDDEQEQDAKDEQKEVSGSTASSDFGLLETASRKLCRQESTDEEKLSIVTTIMRAVPRRAVNLLYGLTKDADFLLRKQLVDLFIKVESPAIIELYRKFIHDEEPLLRLNGIIGLSRLSGEEAREVILAAANDHDAAVRRFVANCLSCTGSNAELAAMTRLANDSDDNVARIAIRKLGRGKNLFSFVNLIPKLRSQNSKVRKEAIEALRAMTGTSLGYKYTASEKEREKSVKKWYELWEKNQANPHFFSKVKSECPQENITSKITKESILTNKSKPVIGKKKPAK